MTFNEIREKLKSKVVGIAGAGGLGSNCAMALARSGVGTIIIADFDIIDLSNLNRQYYFHYQLGKKKVLALKENVEMVNPEINLIPYSIKLEPHHIAEIYEKCDVIVEAFDLAEMKQMIVEAVTDNFPEKPLILGSGMAGWGRNNDIRTEEHNNIIICGDQKSEVSDDNPPLAPRVGIVSMMQANKVLELLLND